MDPLSALSVAGTVVQFVDFSIKILSTTHKLYNSASGNLPAHEELEYVTTDISRFATKLRQPLRGHGVPASSSQPGADLEDICTKCDEVAQDLLTRLNGLKIQKKNGVWQSFRYALMATWAREDLDDLVRRLNAFKALLEMRILAGLRW
jgi:hypothetical protein